MEELIVLLIMLELVWMVYVCHMNPLTEISEKTWDLVVD